MPEAPKGRQFRAAIFAARAYPRPPFVATLRVSTSAQASSGRTQRASAWLRMRGVDTCTSRDLRTKNTGSSGLAQLLPRDDTYSLSVADPLLSFPYTPGSLSTRLFVPRRNSTFFTKSPNVNLLFQLFMPFRRNHRNERYKPTIKRKKSILHCTCGREHVHCALCNLQSETC